MPLKWGILGAGNISGQFAHDLVLSNKNKNGTHVIASIGSSNAARGEEFVKKNAITAKHNQGVVPVVEDYDQFFRNPDVDIVYVGTPHLFHKDQVIQALEHGKNVLCEKPFTVTAAEAREVFAVAKRQKLFVMEATWTRFFPSIAQARKLIYEDEVLGDVYRLSADFSMNFDINALPLSSRARDINLAAGATLDIGIYPLTYTRILLDETGSTNFEVKSFLTLDPTDGVDHLSTYIVKYEDGKHAVLTSSNLIDGPRPFIRVEGSKGVLEMSTKENPAQPQQFTIKFRNGEKEEVHYKDDSLTTGYHGFIYESDAAAAAIAKGEKQCSTMSWDETLLMMDTMDKIRWDGGLYYPGERTK